MGKYREFIKNIFFPKSCLGCGKLGIYTCFSCIRELTRIKKDTCFYCKKRSFFGLTHPGCKRAFGVDGLKNIYTYSSMMKKIVKGTKYRMAIEIMQDFLSSIPPRVIKDMVFYNKLNRGVILIPVPLHKSKQKKRGFNQALIIALFLQKILKRDIDLKVIKRIKNTRPQSSCRNTRERFVNIKGAFSIDRKRINNLKKQSFIIVDDIWTSGSTAKEVCRVLKKEGASKVYVFTLAR